MDDNYKAPLIEAAITMAARNHDLKPAAIFHSDRGSNYTSAQFAKTLTDSTSGSPSGGPAAATTTPWPNLSSVRSKPNAFTVPSILPADTPSTKLRAT